MWSKKTNDASFKANEKLVQLKAQEEEIQKSVKSFDSSIQEEEIAKIAGVDRSTDGCPRKVRKGITEKAGSS